ncbi:MAG: PAS domain-containing protein [Melioribacteraceae bacterium]|nr:PAS domain-containing protein [Melioribacteraceae bacterium]MCF8354183.1 PAS domain-containing protein [Melioribacteraceae bacterium]MCF8394721.1 PAS domain-containing protein [Melioribacteraceae bacterium]MCF8418106.1 PAS domain-containing protein [Melioribacteraceae bacterium]
MKYKVTPTNKVRVLRENDFLVSKTDLKGRITYCNRIFIEFSLYSEAELLGSQHNIIRHPEMPRAVFHMLWNTIAEKNEFFGYIKNMSKDGGTYWVLANVTASVDGNDNIIGYYSVRRKPKESAIETIDEIYRNMLQIERQAGTRIAIDESSKYLSDLLSKKGISYEEYILSL